MKKIKLENNLYAMFDDIDYDFITTNKLKLYLFKAANTNYVRVCYKGDTVAIHRVILGCNIGDGKIVDHIDRNGLNNCRSNLRFCNASQNSANRTPYGASKYLGVTYVPKVKRFIKKHNAVIQFDNKKPWRTKIVHNKKNIHIGYFKSEIDAAKAYNEAAKKYHREFSNLNQLGL
jgi:hypothetical protein